MTEPEAEEYAIAMLSDILKPERIPDVIRRSAPAFDGRRAIDLIMEGRGPEVLEAYERATEYQG